MTLRVFIVGEGANELGRFVHHPARRADHANLRGVIEAFLQKLLTDFEVVDGRAWSKVPSYQQGKGHNFQKKILAAALLARAAHCQAFVFLLDQDNEPARIQAVESALQELTAPEFGLSSAGGVAIPLLEGWILALLGHSGTEGLRPKRATAELEKQYGIKKNSQKMVEVIEAADLKAISKDARAFTMWLDQIRRLPTQIHE